MKKPKTSKRRIKKAIQANVPVGEAGSQSRFKKSGKLKKNFKYTDPGLQSGLTSNRIPFETVRKPSKQKPMRTIKSGTRGNSPRTTIINKTRSL